MPARRRFVPEIRGSDILIAAGVAVLYVLAAKLGLSLAFQAQQVSAVWPPAGLALAAVFRFGPRAVIGVILGAFFANATAEEPLWVAAGIAVGNTLEARAGVAILKRFGFDAKLSRLRDALALLGAATASAAVAATIGVVCLVAGNVQPAETLWSLWSVWWLGDALGDLVLSPFLLVWMTSGIAFRRGAYIEGPILLAGLFAASMYAFIQAPPGPDLKYLIFPFLIWAAIRFGPPATATATAMTYGFAVWATHQGLGPFAGFGPERGLVHLQMFMGVVAMLGLLLGAIAAQRRSAQETAQMSERRLLLALSAARMGVWDWDIGTGRVTWSGELEPLAGLPGGGFAGTYDAFRALVHPDDRDRVETAIREAIETHGLYESEFRILGADGVERWTGARGHTVEDASGRVVRMVGVGIDITAQKRLEEELRRRVKETAEADRRKDEFLAMLAHELRNPLAPIVHATELLGRGDPEIAERAREIIRRQSEHLTKLVDDLLDVSRITRGVVRLEIRRIALGDAIAPAIDTWRHVIGERRQELSIEIPERPLWIEVDPTRFAQTVSNLLHNAANFTPPGGRISISAVEENGSIGLRIRDTGVGMTPEVLRIVFDLFVQGPPPPGGRSSGLGLGLTLVRRLVELHGGTVEAKSEGLGRGSEFVLRLPNASAAAPAVPMNSPPERGPSTAAGEGGRRVLVVDDNADAREALRFLLVDEGYEVRTAGDGPDALREAETFHPDIVLLDIGLPGIDGYEVAQRLRRLPGARGSRIVALSGYGQEQDRERSRAAGFDDHLLKPVSPNRLLDLVKSMSRAEGRKTGTGRDGR